ncbi:MAG: aconitate hydratase AcnA [Alphaproteobacteria bacterium]|nr:aconitate hydratase AcnA [Alphaproteobacteria bacterium]
MSDLNVRRSLTVAGKTFDYFSLPAAEARLGSLGRLPRSLKVLLENLLRHYDGRTVTEEDLKAVVAQGRAGEREIGFRPVRVLMQDFTGVPAIVDLAAMRDAMIALGGDPKRINPLAPVDLVIDHSVSVDAFGRPDAFAKNVGLEMERNRERYAFLRWGQAAFHNFRVVPPGTGICHQVNLEALSNVVWTLKDGQRNGTSERSIACPDTLVGTDSHTTMVNGLSVLGWGVGGIEAEAAMLGQPISMLVPEVVGFELTGKMRDGTTATDLVLTVTEQLRKKGVVGKFVEFYGPGVAELSLADRATIANMAPEYGATCGFFPTDQETLNYLKLSGREEWRVALVESYARAQGLWRDKTTGDPTFADGVSLDIGTVEPSLAGPKRPQDRVNLSAAPMSFAKALAESKQRNQRISAPVAGHNYSLTDGDVMIAAITSCTNTSNPGVMIAAGLLARNAVRKGLRVKPWVKTSLAPGSQVVSDYLARAELQEFLDALGFNLVGYGCMTCIGNSGPLDPAYSATINQSGLVVASVLSGNRNFEGRVNADTRVNYLASPPLVVAYALAGTMAKDLATEPLAEGSDGKPVFLRDIWPSAREIESTVRGNLTPLMFAERYSQAFLGSPEWQAIAAPSGLTYAWDDVSTYVRKAPYFDGMPLEPAPLTDIAGARPLAILGDSVTTDHISPAGSFKPDTPAGRYLTERGVKAKDFNSYGARRGNHEIMMRGTFANVRIKNEMAPGTEGGVTRLMPAGTSMSIYDAAMAYRAARVPLVVIAGKEYGAGSSRDWAAKGPALLGVRAAIAESYERIHRSNLVGLGVLPLEFPAGVTRKTLGLDGSEVFDITGVANGLRPRGNVRCRIRRADGAVTELEVRCRIDTDTELAYSQHGGILPYVLRGLLAAEAAGASRKAGVAVSP